MIKATKAKSNKSTGSAESDASGSAEKKPGAAGQSEKKPNATVPTAPNTGGFVYFDNKTLPRKCKKDKKKIAEKCQPEKEGAQQERLSKKPGLLGKLKFPTKSPGSGDNAGAGWVANHCDLLMIKPSSPQAMYKQLTDIPKDKLVALLAENGKNKLFEMAENRLKEAIAKKLGKLAAKQATVRIVAFLGGPIIGIAVNVAMTAIAIKDAADAMKEFPELVEEIKKAREAVKKEMDEINKLKDEIKKYTKNGKISQQAIVSDMMYGIAESNECIRARRCSLVPYEDSDKLDGDGCCPGQSGHHALAGSMFEGCPGYKHNKALTICVEGTSQYHGSHGVVHRALQNELQNLKRNGVPVPYGATITKGEAIDAAAESINKAFPGSGCDIECLKAQLRQSYSSVMCNPKKVDGLPEIKTAPVGGGGGGGSAY